MAGIQWVSFSPNLSEQDKLRVDVFVRSAPCKTGPVGESQTYFWWVPVRSDLLINPSPKGQRFFLGGRGWASGWRGVAWRFASRGPCGRFTRTYHGILRNKGKTPMGSMEKPAVLPKDPLKNGFMTPFWVMSNHFKRVLRETPVFRIIPSETPIERTENAFISGSVGSRSA